VPATHPHLTPNKQAVAVHQDLRRDISQMRVDKADGGTFRLMMLQNDLKYFKTDEIVAGASATHVRDKISPFYNNEFGVAPLVELRCELRDLTPVDCTHENKTTHVYTVTVPKSIPRPSVLTVVAVKNTT